MDWLSYLTSLPLHEDKTGLKLKSKEIETVNKQFGLPTNFALLYDKDHGVNSLNIVMLFPILLAALKSQTKQLAVAEAKLAATERAVAGAHELLVAFEQRCATLDQKVADLGGDLSQELTATRDDQQKFAMLFSGVFLDETGEEVAHHPESEPAVTPAPLTGKHRRAANKTE